MKTEFRYGTRIQQVRKERAWTQEQLAAAAQLEVRTIQRVERDATKNPETLQAIAGAFNLDLAALRTAWLIAERKLVRTHLATTAKDFCTAERDHPCHAAARTIMAPLLPESEEQIGRLEEQVFADREFIDSDDVDLWRSYVASIQEPLRQLFGAGFAFFLMDEVRDLLFPKHSGFVEPERNHLENWKVRYFMLVPRYGCFRLGENEPLHSFNEACQAAGEALFRAVKKKIKTQVFPNALCAVTHAGNENAIRWCDTCFPVLHGNTRIGFDYIEQVTGISRFTLATIYEGMSDEPFIEGLA